MIDEDGLKWHWNVPALNPVQKWHLQQQQQSNPKKKTRPAEKQRHLRMFCNRNGSECKDNWNHKFNRACSRFKGIPSNVFVLQCHRRMNLIHYHHYLRYSHHIFFCCCCCFVIFLIADGDTHRHITVADKGNSTETFVSILTIICTCPNNTCIWKTIPRWGISWKCIKLKNRIREREWKKK